MVNYKRFLGIIIAPLALTLAGLFNYYNTQKSSAKLGANLSNSESVETNKKINKSLEQENISEFSENSNDVLQEREKKEKEDITIMNESTQSNLTDNNITKTKINNQLPQNPDNTTITYFGNKGEYTVDYELGTYYGCVYKTGCLFLEKDKKIGNLTWKNGNYTYLIDNNKVEVSNKNKLIFEDVFKGENDSISKPKDDKNYNTKIFYGNKGKYTIDYDAGTYYGCVYEKGCLFLGRDKKIGDSTWKNGNYTYSVNDNNIQVHNSGKLIFQDNF